MYLSVSEEHLGKMNMQKKPLNKPLLKAGQCSAGSLKRKHCQLQFLQSEKFIAVGATGKNQGAFTAGSVENHSAGALLQGPSTPLNTGNPGPKVGFRGCNHYIVCRWDSHNSWDAHPSSHLSVSENIWKCGTPLRQQYWRIWWLIMFFLFQHVRLAGQEIPLAQIWVQCDLKLSKTRVLSEICWWIFPLANPNHLQIPPKVGRASSFALVKSSLFFSL